MSIKYRTKSLIERKLEDPRYRIRHEESYEAFKLEAQILLALENKGWSYDDLAKAANTYKSNISRDLKAGGLLSATLTRINRIADALGMKLITLLIPKEQVRFFLPLIEKLVRETCSSSSVVEIKKSDEPILPQYFCFITSNSTAQVTSSLCATGV